MRKHYTTKQINESIAYWKKYLKENYDMTDAEIDETTGRLDEVDWKGLGKKLKNLFMNKTFSKNKGIVDLATVLTKHCKNKKSVHKIKFAVQLDDEKYQVQSFVAMPEQNILGVVVDPTQKLETDLSKTATCKTLQSVMEKANVSNLKSAFTSLQFVDLATVNESDTDTPISENGGIEIDNDTAKTLDLTYEKILYNFDRKNSFDVIAFVFTKNAKSSTKNTDSDEKAFASMFS